MRVGHQSPGCCYARRDDAMEAVARDPVLAYLQHKMATDAWGHKLQGRENLVFIAGYILPMAHASNYRSSIATPPDELRFRVSNSYDPTEFLSVGERCANDLFAAMKGIGRNLAECKEVLDFGCGSGRTLRWFMGLTKLLWLRY